MTSDSSTWRGQDLILEKAEGNPLYIESIVRNLHEQDILTTADTGKTRLRSDARKVQLPEALKLYNEAKAEGLEPNCQP